MSLKHEMGHTNRGRALLPSSRSRKQPGSRSLLFWGTLILLMAKAHFSWANPADYQPYVPPASGGNDSTFFFVILAYVAIWLVLLLYVFFIWRGQRRIEKELHHLYQQLKQGTPASRNVLCPGADR